MPVCTINIFFGYQSPVLQYKRLLRVIIGTIYSDFVELHSASMAYRADPENLMETSLRLKIYHIHYWKSMCYNLSPFILFEKAMILNHIGCTFGDRNEPTHFICLLLKMLMVLPDMAIPIHFIRNEAHIYARALGAFCLRLMASDIDVYYYLEPLYNDHRELRHRLSDGTFVVTTMHEFVTQLLTQQKMFDINLPSLGERKLIDLERRDETRADETLPKLPLTLNWWRRSDLEITKSNKIRVAMGLEPVPYQR